VRGARDLPLARAVVGQCFRELAPEDLAAAFERVIEGARAGVDADRTTMVRIASFIAHELSANGSGAFDALGETALEVGCPLTHEMLAGAEARSLARGGRLAEVGMGLHAWFWPMPIRRAEWQSLEDFRWMRAYFASQSVAMFRRRPTLPRARMHHDPRFIARFLDARWVGKADVVTIAARRPNVPAISLAVATRDRWFQAREVRVALAKNPFTPAPLARALSAGGAEA
jgi:hypothetical protein